MKRTKYILKNRFRLPLSEEEKVSGPAASSRTDGRSALIDRPVRWTHGEMIDVAGRDITGGDSAGWRMPWHGLVMLAVLARSAWREVEWRPGWFDGGQARL